jgi:hypothetical protein
MALAADVKKYVACWMQLGTQVQVDNESPVQLNQIVQGEQYSKEFEMLWNRILERAEAAYLSSTPTSIQQLMEPTWDIIHCARCVMPVAVLSAGVQAADCPCQELDNWPNLELPCPRPPVDSKTQLEGIQNRLSRVGQL